MINDFKYRLSNLEYRIHNFFKKNLNEIFFIVQFKINYST